MEKFVNIVDKNKIFVTGRCIMKKFISIILAVVLLASSSLIFTSCKNPSKSAEEWARECFELYIEDNLRPEYFYLYTFEKSDNMFGNCGDINNLISQHYYDSEKYYIDVFSGIMTYVSIGYTPQNELFQGNKNYAFSISVIHSNKSSKFIKKDDIISINLSFEGNSIGISNYISEENNGY